MNQRLEKAAMRRVTIVLNHMRDSFRESLEVIDRQIAELTAEHLSDENGTAREHYELTNGAHVFAGRRMTEEEVAYERSELALHTSAIRWIIQQTGPTAAQIRTASGANLLAMAADVLGAYAEDLELESIRTLCLDVLGEGPPETPEERRVIDSVTAGQSEGFVKFVMTKALFGNLVGSIERAEPNDLEFRIRASDFEPTTRGRGQSDGA